ncbi:uncharacterized protein LOC117344233 [Pecten maximus]|uniref:uncharacterized protein LOC117344233 n=1 Tax=Pecten maximus TaxID=6579 RepID=UPI0014587A03|nr:uncharacterized protein LOC117344233 [Pecten maximus]
MASRQKKEGFKISNKAVMLKPESEPEAEIDIPAGTFKSCQLLVKFVDTAEIIKEYEQDENHEENPSDNKSVLMTNILDISTSDQQQPNKEVEMKIPVTAKSKSEGIVILMTSNPDPNLLKWQWEEIPAHIDTDGKAVFKIRHFSSIVGISRPLYEANPEAATDMIRDASDKKRKVEIVVAVKIPELDEKKTNMIIICGTKHAIKSEKKTYSKSYHCFSLGPDLPFVPEGQRFKFVIQGNFKEQSDDYNIDLIFKGSQVSSRALEIVSTSENPLDLSGTVDIYEGSSDPVAHDQVPVVEAKCCCYNSGTKKTSVKPDVDKIEQTPRTIAFKATLTKRDLESSMRSQPSRLEELRKAVDIDLSPEETRQLAVQIGIDVKILQNSLDGTVEEGDQLMAVLNQWLISLAKNNMVSQLKEALAAIGRQDLIKDQS